MPKLKVFSCKDCPACQELKEWLNKESIDYEDVDICDPVNEKEAEYVIENYGAIPIVKIKEKTILGFQPEEIKKAIQEL